MAALEELIREPVDVLDLLGRTADGMVAVSPGGAILAWNPAAVDLLEHEEADVIGRPCHEVLAFADRCGNLVCSAFCAGCRPALTKHTLDTSVPCGLGQWLRVHLAWVA